MRQIDSCAVNSFFTELQRRKVYRVAAAYGVVAWFLIQFAATVFPAWELPFWCLRLVIILVLIGFPIALLSLGATRRMTIRAKAAPRRSVHVDLETGSLLLMDYATQIHYTHGVPKTSAAIGERIILAFRMKPDQQPPNVSGNSGVYR